MFHRLFCWYQSCRYRLSIERGLMPLGQRQPFHRAVLELGLIFGPLLRTIKLVGPLTLLAYPEHAALLVGRLSILLHN